MLCVRTSRNDKTFFSFPKAGLAVAALALFLSALPSPNPIFARDSSPSSVGRPGEILKIPAEYGEVVYRYNEGSPNQLFIIGMSHRDSLTRMNGTRTAKTQAEVYKIGEWLIRNKGLELLLPEGFFKTKPEKVEKEMGPRVEAAKKDREVASPSLETLEKELGNNRTFINAEMLLIRDYPLCIDQVEDKICYDAVSNGIQKLANCGSNLDEYFSVRSELDYLQDVRTGTMLQKIPGIIETEFQQGRIKNRKAFLTIGMSHILPIIRYLNEKRIAIYPPATGNAQSGNHIEELNLAKADFGVSIILPRTLVDDPKILRVNRLDKIVADSRK